MRLTLTTLILIIGLNIKAQFVPTVTWTFMINSASFGGAATADLDNDGKKEIVFTTYNNDGKVYCVNAENGTLKWSYNIGGCGDVAPNIYDLDKDGQLDVFVHGSCNPTAFCFNGNTGALTWSVGTGGGDSPATIADIDKDNKPEVVFGNFSGELRVLNGEDGSLAKSIQVYTTSALQTDPVLVDANNDGNLDIIVGSYHNNSTSLYSIICYDYNTSVPIWTNTISIVNTLHAYHGGALADIDKDGKLEYVIGANNGMVRALNVEDGSVLWTVNNPGKQAFYAISIADVNKDDTLDVIYHRSDAIELLNGYNAKVEWTYTLAASMGGSFRGSVVTDLNGNGQLDLVSGHWGGKVLSVEPFTGTGWTFNSVPHFPTYPANIPSIYSDNCPLVADFDGDGALDVFFVMGYGTYTTNPNSTGKAFMIKGGVGTCPEWTMFRHDHNRSGYISKTEVNTQCGTTNVAELEGNKIKCSVFPQPVVGKSIITVEGMNTDRVKLVISDLQGRIIEAKTANDAIYKDNDIIWEWNCEKVNDGLYIYQIDDGINTVKGKLIRSR